MKKIVVCGKGGVGKSLIVYLLSKAIIKKGYNVVVIDSDESNLTLHKLFGFEIPPQPFIEFLGGKKALQQSMRRQFQSSEKEFKMSAIESTYLTTEQLEGDYVKKDGALSLMAVGKIKEPLEGCACPMGVLTKELIDKIVLKPDEIMIVDTEAGVEHFGRGIENGIDTVIAVAEPYLDSIEVAEKIIELAGKLNKNTHLLINKVPPGMEQKVKEILDRKGLAAYNIIHFSQDTYLASMEGRPDMDEQIFGEIQEILERIWKNTPSRQ